MRELMKFRIRTLPVPKTRNMYKKTLKNPLKPRLLNPKLKANY